MLSLEEVKLIIKSGRPDWILKAEKESLKYSVHINGEGVTQYLTPIEGWENPQQEKIRRELVTSNRFLFENLTRPIDKVFSATGGNNVYPKKNKDKLLKTISNIRHGYSIKKWIQNIQANKYYTDPNGLVFFEWNKDNAYPTVKTVGTIFNYQTDGRDVQWVVFQPETSNPTDKKTPEEKTFRVIDDRFDYTYKQKGEDLTLIKEKTFKNPFGKCPAIVNSDIVHFDLDRKDSPFAPVIELADHYLRTGSISNISENYHGYPIFWAYGQPCKRCHGEGSVNNDGVIEKCPSCDGSGTSFKKDVTDGIKLKTPQGDEQKIAPDIAGYVTPPVESLKALRESQDSLWQQIHFTTWGTSYQRDQETATATWIDAQPVNERLSKFSESFEDMEQKMTELIALFLNGSANDISINWGKRFMIESPDAIWLKYTEARSKGAPRTALDYLLNQFYQSEYANDAESLVTSIKRIKLEPFIHLTEKEVKDLGVTGRDLTAKLYFNEWIKSLEDGYIFVTDLKKLKTEFESYINEIDSKLNPVSAVKIDPALLPDLTQNERRSLAGFPEITAGEDQILAQVIGVGGTQSLTEIIVSPTLTPEQKVQLLIKLFSFTEEEARLVMDVKEGEKIEKPEETITDPVKVDNLN